MLVRVACSTGKTTKRKTWAITSLVIKGDDGREVRLQPSGYAPPETQTQAQTQPQAPTQAPSASAAPSSGPSPTLQPTAAAVASTVSASETAANPPKSSHTRTLSGSNGSSPAADAGGSKAHRRTASTTSSQASPVAPPLDVTAEEYGDEKFDEGCARLKLVVALLC
jgi:hypothetical protein